MLTSADTVLLASGGVDKVGWIAWIIIGGLAGWIASKFMGTDAQQGVLLNIVVGIVGGLLGGFLLKLIGVDVAGGGYFFTFITAVVGACILLFIVKLVTGSRAKR
ncbi:GlsB/YeaQ/YmgE family stress response membrane protein [Tsukamurella sp. 8F]|uniref:GlsB/YeaQ/YmgE family stress response membrane protein n=1 Tax=unclassified Tsukamurella TaxID=2633480 RepID=UPI0023B8FA8B|nr:MULTISPECIES: GlsB/YeaQ/YmgE family stress response membrane protein [unclassified Tsukamurella]MDF0529465.1 GlsB/YeaQ/YmgE family stress response membrane protein [Tsukamurella sp. 8J]MDF0585847.1 GlsB/YeaQ/YmgE family stress response membrane protein [Tsukamurella sp. 8F]